MQSHLYSLPTLLLFLLWYNSFLYAQTQDRPGSLRMSYELGFQEHDRRVPDYSQNGLGTYQLAMGVEKSILFKEAARLIVGAAYGLELNTFRRRYDHCLVPFYVFPDGSCDEMLRYAKRHVYHQIRLNTRLQVNVYQHTATGMRMYAHVSGTPSFQFRKGYANSHQGLLGSHGKWEFAFFSFEANGGLGFSLHDLDFSFYYRMYNYRRVDRVLFEKPGTISGDYEERNLFKVGVMVSTPLPELKWLRKKQEGD